MFTKVLIANRGEISRRIILTLQKMDIQAVAIYDSREKNSRYVLEADESYSLGEGALSDTFLNIQKIVQIAKHSNCSAIHPGYGFLSENPKFARACSDEGIVFIGPTSETIEILGNKQKALNLAVKLGIPVIPNIHGTIDFIVNTISDDFYPCIIKASAGGGGKAMEVVYGNLSLKKALKKNAAESQRYFSNSEIFVEKYLKNSRHIEVQILGDKAGNIVHLFERECSIQRRYQKIIEESPAPELTDLLRNTLLSDAQKLASEVNYLGAGTVEFLLDENGNHYFLEMNTRIQVEHGVSEIVTGIDIVEQQIKIAKGKDIELALSQIKISGHSIEARVYSENPSSNFRPSSGLVNLVSFPEKNFIRVDTDLQSGDSILTEFDALQAKILVHGKNREDAVSKLKFALNASVIHGVKTNIGLLNEIAKNKDFELGKYNTSFLSESFARLNSSNNLNFSQKKVLIASGVFLSLFHLPEELAYNHTTEVTESLGYWRLDRTLGVKFNKKEYIISLLSTSSLRFTIKIGKKLASLNNILLTSEKIQFHIDEKAYVVFYSWNTDTLNLQLGFDHSCFDFVRSDFLVSRKSTHINTVNEQDKLVDGIYAPLSGKIIRIITNSQELLSKGDNVLTIESMKMENDICIPFKAKIDKIHIRVGDQVEEGQKLVSISKKPDN